MEKLGRDVLGLQSVDGTGPVKYSMLDKYRVVRFFKLPSDSGNVPVTGLSPTHSCCKLRRLPSSLGRDSPRYVLRTLR